jgi:hypothetical protein
MTLLMNTIWDGDPLTVLTTTGDVLLSLYGE